MPHKNIVLLCLNLFINTKDLPINIQIVDNNKGKTLYKKEYINIVQYNIIFHVSMSQHYF